MSQSLFQRDAVLAATSSLANSLQDPRINGSYLGPSFFLSVLVLLTVGLFVNISLGATARGIITSETEASSVVALRSGMLTYTSANLKPIPVKKGDVVARIKSLDITMMNGGPNEQFSNKALGEKRERLLKRIEERKASHRVLLAENEAMISSLKSLSEQTADLIPIYQIEIKRLETDITASKNSFDKGLVVKERLRILERTLSDRQIQLRESQIRLADLDRQIAQSRLQKVQLEDSQSSEILSLENEIANVDTSLQTNTDLKTIEIKAEHDGLLVPRGFKQGQLVQAGDLLFDISPPENTFVFAIDIPADQVGELKNGMSVKISITAYPHFEYGFIDGTVDSFTGTTTKDLKLNGNIEKEINFRLIVRADPESLEDFLKDKTLASGMEVDVHIKKEKVAFWRFIAAPLLRFEQRFSL